MRILEVSRYKSNFFDHQLPFVTEQGEELRNAGCEVDYFLIKGNYIRAVKKLKEKIREFKPDVVHAHFGLSAITAELQSIVPVVTTFHNGETLNWHVNLLSSLMSLRAKHVIYVAQHIYDLCYFKAKHYSIIPCGVPMEQMIITSREDARKQLGWDMNKKYILFGGAFNNERKNYILLKNAVERLEGGKTEEISVGTKIREEKNGQMQSEWEKIDGGEKMGDVVCVEMKGLTRAECVLRMCAVDLFVLPSHSEGSPQALKEAMAVNCPCLATDIADVRELFGDMPGHFILRNPRKTHERWDADEKSLDEMTELLRNALAYKGRTNGRGRIIDAGLTNKQVAERLMNIYKSLV